MAHMNRRARGEKITAVFVAVALALIVCGRVDRASTRQLPWGLVTVRPGDSLWSIAEKHGPPGADVRWVVARMRDINELSSADLRAGQRLIVPCDRGADDADGGNR